MPPVNQPDQSQNQSSVSEQAKQQEKENVERAAAATGAEAVAESVKKAADAAIAGARAQSTAGLPPGDFIVTGTPGGRFELRAKSGPIFSSGGSVFLNGKPQKVVEWGADYIRGVFDADATSGEVSVPIDEKTRRVGYFRV
jgi:hypothetical protein